MTDLNNYDKGISGYLNDISLNRMPLICWDFYGNYLQRLNKSMTDLRNLDSLALNNNWVLDLDLEKELHDHVILVTDLQALIVFASQNIVMMNGYKSEEIIGKSPKIFQGESTSKIVSDEIREAILLEKPFEKIVVNYRKDGEVYNCHIKGFPIFNIKGRLSHFIALEKAA